ncbi:MAG: transposase [Planctomycetes bacterium]|nr:transposase [Planctomycetota bacterium]
MEYNHPIAFLLTVVTYGAWLHGDERGSVKHGEPAKFLPPDELLKQHNASNLKHPSATLNARQRGIVRRNIESYCDYKKWFVSAVNVRTNHFHVVVAAVEKPEKMLNGIKAAVTRKLREADEFVGRPVWAVRGSKRRLYTRKSLDLAIDYVVNRQGDPLPEE